MAYTDTALWKRTLGPQPNDTDRDARARLSAAYLKMRECVGPLVEAAHRDCPGLTIHDLTHLDALWEIADIIVGPDYEVTPVEAFVFGAAVLLHDAGMAIASYERGFEEIKATTEWSNAVAISLRAAGLRPDAKSVKFPPAEISNIATFNVLRALHAKQAETLLTRTWTVPGRSAFGIMDDDDLREYYGRRIGRIAHSHNWSIDKTQRECSAHVTPMVGLPSSWLLNELKIACMLRCADAAHIDARRAPKMAYAINAPKGLSDRHWKFQNKLGQVGRQDHELTYSSSPFLASEADSWWIAFDVARMIDREIHGANTALQEDGERTFVVECVRGVQNAKTFAHQLPVLGWEPVEAEVTVSDPVHLALTLGGRNLYGRGYQAPIREILQNAIDAVRGRRGERSPEIFPGNVRVVIELARNGSLVIHFDDDGMGMPPSVLTGPLIDFGKSIWSSPLLSEEYPGLSTSLAKPVGKFGIGFFSVFLLGPQVNVSSRRYNAGLADAKTLVFSKLSKRPLLRPATSDDLPEEYCTRVSVVVDEVGLGQGHESVNERESIPDLAHKIATQVVHLSAAADVNIDVRDEVNRSRYRHNWDWAAAPASDFLDELFAQRSAEQRAAIKRSYSSLVRPLKDSSGAFYGRAALMIGEHEDYRREFSTSYKSVGGVVTSHQDSSRLMGPSGAAGLRYVGVLASSTDDASRKSSNLDVPRTVVEDWLNEQVSLIDRSKHQVMTLMGVAHRVHAWGANPGDLPFCYSGGQIVTRLEVCRRISEAGEAYLLLVKNVVDSLNWLSFEGISVGLLTDPIKPQVLASTIGNSEAFGRELGQWISLRLPYDIKIEQIPSELVAKNPVLGVVLNVLGNDVDATVKYIDVSNVELDIPAARRLALVIKPKSTKELNYYAVAKSTI